MATAQDRGIATLWYNSLNMQAHRARTSDARRTRARPPDCCSEANLQIFGPTLLNFRAQAAAGHLEPSEFFLYVANTKNTTAGIAVGDTAILTENDCDVSKIAVRIPKEYSH